MMAEACQVTDAEASNFTSEVESRYARLFKSLWGSNGRAQRASS